MKIFFADSFTNKIFKGNPACVCIVDDFIDANTMQQIAKEIGFSETAFIQQLSKNDFSIRFFTPKQEITLCGHATLAAAKVIFSAMKTTVMRFITIENVKLLTEQYGSQIRMEFPVYEIRPINIPQEMLVALGIDNVLFTGFNFENKIILIEIVGTDILKNIQPNFEALLKSYEGINGVLVTVKDDSTHFDFHYRYFWSWVGTNEDPVTGGVQTFLAKYWANKINKKRLKAFQSSERTGEMDVEVYQDKVYIYGEAIIVLEGNFKIN